MQRGAQSARRHFGGVVLPTYVFQYIFKKSRSHAAWGGDVFPLWRSGALFSSMRRSPLGGKNGPCGDEKRSHAAWRSFRLAQERSHAAWRSFLRHGSVRSGPVDGLRFRKQAFPCSVALVFLKKLRSHAAWRSFCVLGPARHPLAAGLVGTYLLAAPGVHTS